MFWFLISILTFKHYERFFVRIEQETHTIDNIYMT